MPLGLLTFFIHGFGDDKSIGGGTRRFIELSKRFRRMGINVWTVEGSPSLKRLGLDTAHSSFEVKRRFNRFPSHIQNLLMAFHITGLVLRLFRHHPFHIIYVNTGDLQNLLPAYILSRLLRRPMVVVFHGIAVNDQRGFVRLVMSRIRDNFLFPFAVLHTLLDFVRWVIYPKAEACLAVSRATYAEVMRQFKVDNHRLYVTGNGVDMVPHNWVDEHANPHYDAVYVGRLDSYKGIETLIRAWKVVTKHLPQARLLVIGGEGRRIPHYREIVKGLQLQNNIVFYGQASSGEVTELLTMAKVFVFPSKSEGFGLGVAEAMACGLPCVISDIPALRENFGEVTILVKPDDVMGFAYAILDLLKDGAMRKGLGLQAREYVKRFSWDEVAKREVRVFMKLVQGSKRRRQKGASKVELDNSTYAQDIGGQFIQADARSLLFREKERISY